MDGSRGHYAKWNKSEKAKTIWSLLYVESKKNNKRNPSSWVQKTDWCLQEVGGGVGEMAELFVFVFVFLFWLGKGLFKLNFKIFN